MVFRVYVEKKKELAQEAASLYSDLTNLLGIEGLKDLRLLNRYDAEDIDPALFDYAVKTVFSEPQLDITCEEPETEGGYVFAVEFLPGQFDQRADSAAQCIQLISQGERPLIRSAKVYVLYGDLTEEDIDAVKKYVINPVEAREASLEKPETLKMVYDAPGKVKTLTGFTKLDREGAEAFISEYGLAMDADDLEYCRQYFEKEQRDPTITEIKMIDTYWSDHCRHTTFLTIIDDVQFEDELLQKTFEDYLKTREEVGDKKPVCLMDLATVAVKYLRKEGFLTKLDESEEINACTVKIDVDVDGVKEPWLLLFKNETHNHPTEIEPFGGAATCIGGAIRDPLSGRAYVYSAMRLTGAADPTVPVSETIPGKLPQRKLVTTAANGYSSYGNQIGLTTGMVDEVYHPGYAAK
ncbi:MAG: phosphoribosylformylglycinamidine synthase, partial [Lachnospiraceae bacterium]|nr:phosphoribosylformylglycinamidine synthase [Lachnospiraceae bacterium]